MIRMRVTAGRFLLRGILLSSMVLGLSCQLSGTSGLTEREADTLLSAYQESRNTANLALLDQVYDSTVVIHDCGMPGDIRGLAALKSYYAESHTGFPDFKMTIDSKFVSGESIIIRWTITATHTGVLRGIPPTGKQVRFSGTAIDRVAKGRIVEEWVDWNVLSLLQQLGFSLTPPSAARP